MDTVFSVLIIIPLGFRHKFPQNIIVARENTRKKYFSIVLVLLPENSEQYLIFNDKP